MRNFLSTYKKHIFLCALLVNIYCTTKAQKNEILHANIASLQVVADTKWLEPPVIGLNDGTPIHISFDEKSHDYKRYSYEITHCDANWNETKGMFTSDFIAGFANDLLVGEGEKSINTNTQYTHYSFSIPNENCQITKSGNYKVTVFDDTSHKEPVFTACFMVVEPLVSVQAEVTTNTDKDINDKHQQLDFQLNYSNIRSFNPRQEFTTVVTINNTWDSRRVGIPAQITTGDKMIWSHNTALIFDAGNEYRKFELLDVNHSSMGVEKMRWENNEYHAYLWQDTPRFSYIYDEDANGAFYIRNSDNYLNNITSDYIKVHFTLKCPRSPYDIYLNGRWTNDAFTTPYKMIYDEAEQVYKAIVPLKQGYYSYQYVEKQSNGQVNGLPSEGCFYETENKYQIYIYYKGQSERFTKLVGFQEVQVNKKGL